ncbi:sporulation initiation factor Spo0A C-terminal domain-containing protein [Paenibacillus sp. UNC451MF]|uniref:sporulation initiation factor Spo0A C-terminal domain-containing protein n=1 Tax=Paenibacillus sp. UNC451MF TaxID=1449063 RepID=UPI00068D33D3|nr:sporulation initiation factor Spo0A C-terminal domain-containing protein [Paenibacillus sp. UNC451MF]
MSVKIEEALLKELKMLTNKVYEVEANQRNMMKLLVEMNDKWSQIGASQPSQHTQVSQPLRPSESPKINAMASEIQGLKFALSNLDNSPKPTISRASLDPESIDEEKRVIRLLDFLCVPDHIKGFQYLKDAILIVINDPDATSAITRSVYPVIAEKYRTTPSRVERAIRHAVDVCWGRVDKEAIREVFGNTSILKKSVPTNLDLITMSANWCKIMKMKQ